MLPKGLTRRERVWHARLNPRTAACAGRDQNPLSYRRDAGIRRGAGGTTV
jgi:hypothetical protein